MKKLSKRKTKAADSVYWNAVAVFHTTNLAKEGRSLPEDAETVLELLKQIKKDVCVLYGIKPSAE